MDVRKTIWIAAGSLVVLAITVSALRSTDAKDADVLAAQPEAVMAYATAEEAAEDIGHSEPAMREKAVLAYARRTVLALPKGESFPLEKTKPLVQRLESDPSPAVRAAAATALGATRSPEVVAHLGVALEDTNPRVQERAKMAIARITGITLNFKGGGSEKKHRLALKYFHEVLMPELKAHQ